MIKAIIYTNPGCMKCRMTRTRLAKAGMPVETRQVSDYPQIVEALREVGQLTLPYVQIIDEEPWDTDLAARGLDSWHDFRSTKIKHWEEYLQNA